MKNSVLKNCTNFILTGSALALAGCSVNPTPVGPKAFAFKTDYTLEIIKRVRCEARDAMVVRAANLLLDLNDFSENKAIAEQFLNNPSAVKNYQDWELDPRAYVLASPILNSTIAFDFIFTTTEKNNDSFTPALTSNVGSNVFTVGLVESKFDKERQNRRLANVPARNFDTFQSLNCPGDKSDRVKTASKKDFSYPLRGNVELAKTINTYIDFLYLDIDQRPENFRAELTYKALRAAATKLDRRIGSEKLEEKEGRYRAFKKIEDIRQVITKTGKAKCKTSTACKEARACFSYVLGQASDVYISDFYSAYNASKDPKVSMTDNLKFTTTISGGVEPKIVYGAPSSLDIQSLAFSFKPSRTDQHQVQVAITAPIPKSPKKKISKEVFAKGDKGSKFFIETNTKEIEAATVPKFCNAFLYEPKIKSPSSKPRPSTTVINRSATTEKMLSNDTAFQIRSDDENVRLEKVQEIKRLQNESDKQIFIDNFRQAIE